MTANCKAASNIKVAVRIRPVLPHELQRGVEPAQTHLVVVDSTQLRVTTDRQIQ